MVRREEGPVVRCGATRFATQISAKSIQRNRVSVAAVPMWCLFGRARVFVWSARFNNGLVGATEHALHRLKIEPLPRVSRANPDGNTLLIISPSFVVLPWPGRGTQDNGWPQRPSLCGFLERTRAALPSRLGTWPETRTLAVHFQPGGPADGIDSQAQGVAAIGVWRPGRMCTIEDENAAAALAAEGIHPPSQRGTTPYW